MFPILVVPADPYFLDGSKKLTWIGKIITSLNHVSSVFSLFLFKQIFVEGIGLFPLEMKA